MRLYPASPRRAAATVAGDLAVVLLLCVFAWAGMRVHDAVAELASIGRGIQDSGRAISSTARETTSAVEGAFNDAAATVEGVPLVGGDLANALRDAPRSATRPLQETADEQGAQLVAAGREQERRTYQLAKLVGWLTFLLPALVLLAWKVPGRVRQVKQMTTAERLLRGAPEHILAARAAFSLPFSTLTQYTHDPFGDLAEGRHRALLAALADESGVPISAPRSAPGASSP
jgi:hypothetical protein